MNNPITTIAELDKYVAGQYIDEKLGPQQVIFRKDVEEILLNAAYASANQEELCRELLNKNLQNEYRIKHMKILIEELAKLARVKEGGIFDPEIQLEKINNAAKALKVF